MFGRLLHQVKRPRLSCKFMWYDGGFAKSRPATWQPTARGPPHGLRPGGPPHGPRPAPRGPQIFGHWYIKAHVQIGISRVYFGARNRSGCRRSTTKESGIGLWKRWNIPKSAAESYHACEATEARAEEILWQPHPRSS